MPKVEIDGVELEYEVMGEHGEPMLLIMGLGAQMILWPDEFCRLLVDRGFRVIRFDNRDVGLSTKLDDVGIPNVRKALVRSYLGLPVKAPYDLSHMADDTAGLLDTLGLEGAHVVGASMGGMIAQVLAARHPDRVRSLTSIMSSTGSRRAMLSKPVALRGLLRRPPKTRQENIDHLVDFHRLIRGPRFAFNEGTLRDVAARAFDRGYHPRGVARQLAAIASSGDRRAMLRTIKAPTLVIHGSHDPLVPLAGGRDTVRNIPGARLKIIDGMGHELPRGAWPLIVSSIARHASKS